MCELGHDASVPAGPALRYRPPDCTLRSGHADGQLPAGARGEVGQGAGNVGQRVGPLHRDRELAAYHVVGQPFEGPAVGNPPSAVIWRIPGYRSWTGTVGSAARRSPRVRSPGTAGGTLRAVPAPKPKKPTGTSRKTFRSTSPRSPARSRLTGGTARPNTPKRWPSGGSRCTVGYSS